MNEELPDFLPIPRSLKSPTELRARVLAAVEAELARRRKPRWERAIEWSVAASLTLGIGLSVWRWQVDQSPQFVVADPAGRTIERGDKVVRQAVGTSSDRMVARRDRFVGPDGTPVGENEYERYLKAWARILEE